VLPAITKVAQRPKRCCSYPNCKKLVERGRCPDHLVEQKSSAAKGGYDRDWQKLRAVKLAIDPFCELRITCQGVEAKQVDHTIPWRLDPIRLRLNWDNLKSTCVACHLIKTERDKHTDWSSTYKPNLNEKITF
jgi:5-methylcytosine-specific restriction enzyme A